MVFSRVSGKFLVGINRHEQETKNSTFPLIIHIIHKQVFNRVISLYNVIYALVAFAYFVFA